MLPFQRRKTVNFGYTFIPCYDMTVRSAYAYRVPSKITCSYHPRPNDEQEVT